MLIIELFSFPENKLGCKEAPEGMRCLGGFRQMTDVGLLAREGWERIARPLGARPPPEDAG